MARSSQPTPPRAQEQSRRRLSHAGMSSERPIRAQVVVASALALVMVAVPLYLLRRPSSSTRASATGAHVPGFGGVIRAEQDAGAPSTDVMLGPLQRVRCGPSPTQTTGEGGLCD